jgi:hypothetical protein
MTLSIALTSFDGYKSAFNSMNTHFDNLPMTVTRFFTGLLTVFLALQRKRDDLSHAEAQREVGAAASADLNFGGRREDEEF